LKKENIIMHGVAKPFALTGALGAGVDSAREQKILKANPSPNALDGGHCWVKRIRAGMQPFHPRCQQSCSLPDDRI